MDSTGGVPHERTVTAPLLSMHSTGDVPHAKVAGGEVSGEPTVLEMGQTDPMFHEEWDPDWDPEKELVKLYGEDWMKTHCIEVTGEAFCPGLEAGWLICTLCHKRLAGMTTVLTHVEGRNHRKWLAWRSSEILINLHASQPPETGGWGAYKGLAGTASSAQPVQQKPPPPEDPPPVSQPPPPPPLQLLRGKDKSSSLRGPPPPPPPSIGLFKTLGGPAPPPPPGPPPPILCRPPPGDPPQNEDKDAAPAAAATVAVAAAAQGDQETQRPNELIREEAVAVPLGSSSPVACVSDQSQIQLQEATAIVAYDATEFLEDGQQEAGYLPLVPGDRLVLHGEPVSGHATNQAPLYVYGSKFGDSSAQGWFPTRCCSTDLIAATNPATAAPRSKSPSSPRRFEC